MNRRGFISLLAGAAGAPFVPWRGLAHPTIVLPPRAPLIIPPLYYAPHLGQTVQCLADYHRPEAPIEYLTTKWKLATAVYMGSITGWHFIGGEWMTVRDRNDFVDAIDGKTSRYTGFAELSDFAADNVTLVRLHR